MLGKAEGRQKRVRWLDGITSSTDMSWSTLLEETRDREDGCAAVPGGMKSQTQLSN